MDRVEWAKWFIEHGFAIFPIAPETKIPVIKGWGKYSTTPLTDEEKKQYLEMVEKGYNYAVPGGQKNLVILDFENKELLKAWIGEDGLNKLCSETLCVDTPHGGLHVYVTADDIPEHKFNPVFTKDGKGIADLQSFDSYVLGPESCINHKHCNTDKCPWKGQDYTTRYRPINNNEVGKADLKDILNFLIEKGKKIGIEPSRDVIEWLSDRKEELKAEEDKDVEEFIAKLKKKNKFKSVEEAKSKICSKLNHERLEYKVICEGKTYADVGIDRSRGDFKVIKTLLYHGVGDPDLILQVLPNDSKAKNNEKWDTRKYFLTTLKNAWKEKYELCLEYENGVCNGTFIIANNKGVFIKRIAKVKNTKIDEKKRVSSLKVNKIEEVRFNGIGVDLEDKFIKITAVNGNIITGSIDEITTLVKQKYGLTKENEFKMLLNNKFESTSGYYAVGVWFDGEKLNIATESLYNPPWKKIDKYKLPPEVSREKKVEVLRRILGTVISFKAPDLVTWILSFGLMGNFAHYLRQRIGYFPHIIMTGRPKTGKTTLTVLNQYLYWGNNSLPPIKPKSETQLRHLLSQNTLITPIEEWNEIANDNDQMREMLRNLHSSAQSFVLRKVTSSNSEFNGVFLALSSVLADTNFTQDIDSESSDKVIFIPIDQDEGIDLRKAEEYDALLKYEMKNDYNLHDILHSLGIELLQIASEKLKALDFNKERADLLNSIIQVGYESWVELFRRYEIELTPTVQGFNEFPLPVLKTVETETEEDLEQVFEEFIYKKTMGIRPLPENKDDLIKFGFYFEKDMVVCNHGFVSEFRKWMTENKGMRDRSVERLIKELGLHKSSISIEGKTVNVYKRKMYTPLIAEISK
ncbi:DNA primase, phage associated [Saccharolobus shibatae B12]|uniref:DNA primase, phage associated n=1 Tax=Saccharolobus shibatae (strain ATCC 51178 / DSM 5389 / JCM 8931 / NBRC 15437 / B12) TaxID=523848 RepID=A0A8F5BQE8_SACSH|nr:bifunctional DNA primase/polymerase [Saccharolobus shibatae]QXJ29556.1 DNA primase, phage associated [Saccharolobus shibatae B12]